MTEKVFINQAWFFWITFMDSYLNKKEPLRKNSVFFFAFFSFSVLELFLLDDFSRFSILQMFLSFWS